MFGWNCACKTENSRGYASYNGAKKRRGGPNLDGDVHVRKINLQGELLHQSFAERNVLDLPEKKKTILGVVGPRFTLHSC